MIAKFKAWGFLAVLVASSYVGTAQKRDAVTVIRSAGNNQVDVRIGGKLFTSFLYPDSLEKPVLFPIYAANGATVTRGFPLKPKPGEPTDHPHHIGLWFNYENLNGLDFWNNSYAIPKEKKNQYGWIRTDKVLETVSGKTGVLSYHANWTNQAKETIVEETTRFEFSAEGNQRIIDRFTTLKANIDAVFNDVKDGMLGLRLAHELEMPSTEDQKFTDDKGIVTIVKAGADKVANGNYITSAGKTGNAAWGSRGEWCKVYGRIGADSISVAIIDHPKNPNYPTFWHARGYGLFAANPLGEKVFTEGKSALNLTLKKGETVTFRYRVVISSGKETLGSTELNAAAQAFGKK
jgi:hypothetical protein